MSTPRSKRHSILSALESISANPVRGELSRTMNGPNAKSKENLFISNLESTQSRSNLNTIIYHNPRCSKSRAALALLIEHGVSPTIIEYLKTPPDRTTLQQLLRALGLGVRDIVRTQEPDYHALGLSTASDETMLDAISTHPILLERPIVVCGERASIGRPPENILPLLDTVRRAPC